MPYGGGVADVLGVVDELGALGCVVTKVAGWYLEFCENLVKPLAISSSTMFLVNLTCSENIVETSSGVSGRLMRYLCCVYLFRGADRSKNRLLDLCNGAATIFCVAYKKFLHLLLLSSPLVFLECLANFFWHVIEGCHDDVLVADFESGHWVECPDLDLTRDSSQRSRQKVC
jgi:hypothetical protein